MKKKIITGKTNPYGWFVNLEKDRQRIIDSIERLYNETRNFENSLSDADFKKFKKKIDRIYELRETLIKNK